MMYPTPITQRAKARPERAPITMEVTIDAAGTTPTDYFKDKEDCGCGCG